MFGTRIQNNKEFQWNKILVRINVEWNGKNKFEIKYWSEQMWNGKNKYEMKY